MRQSMNNFQKQQKFELSPVIEQKPFESYATQSFFLKWCDINDSIVPNIISRTEWEKIGLKGILEKREDGKQNLYIPDDLQLWEMIGVVEVVDYDTFAKKPNLRNEKKNELLVLGKTFEDAGVYIAQRLDSINEGKHIAEALAVEFYDYGRSLLGDRKTREGTSLDVIKNNTLTENELTYIDRFLAGNNLYKSRQEKVEKTLATDSNSRNDLYEIERGKALSQFFRVSDQAFKLEEETWLMNDKPAESLKPWQAHAPIHTAFLNKVQGEIKKELETPKRELFDAIFSRGIEKLLEEMKHRDWRHAVNSFFKKFDINLQLEQKKLIDGLNIDKLKQELDSVRDSEDKTKISSVERKIADKIQTAVSSFPYKSGANNPSEMVEYGYINCVGASTLGGALMREAGLNYLVGDVPEHSILFLVTSDGNVEWRDMLSSSYNGDLTNEVINGSHKDGSPITVSDIIKFSHNPAPEGLMFDINNIEGKNKIKWFKDGDVKYVTLFEPEYGQKIQILYNAGGDLLELKRYSEAVEAYNQVIALNPKHFGVYNNLAVALRHLNRDSEAIKMYREAIKIHPKDSVVYHNLGKLLDDLGRNEESIESYEKFLEVVNRDENKELVERIERMIDWLKKTKT